MAKHGTRTMYVHYGCRCEECCRAEHRQYLKRKRTQERQRTHSKWGDNPYVEYETTERRRETQRAYNKRRCRMIRENTPNRSGLINWTDIAEKYDMKCAICGCTVDPTDMWIGSDGRKRFGRKYPTVDHIVSLKNGGADVLENVQLACKHCNSVKGSKAYKTAI